MMVECGEIVLARGGLPISLVVGQQSEDLLDDICTGSKMQGLPVWSTLLASPF